MPEITGQVHHVNLSVSDVDRSERWYSDLFGLTRLARVDDADGRWSKVILRHPGGLLIGLTAHASNGGDRFNEERTGLDHFALVVADEAALGDWERRLDELEVDHSPVKTTPLGRLIVLRDPDNIQLEVYAPA